MTTKVEYQCELYNTHISLPLGELYLTCAITYPLFWYNGISDLVQKSGCNMAASEIVIRDGGISERGMSDVSEMTYRKRHRAFDLEVLMEGMKGLVIGY
jgi:hypothetical protein